MNGRTAVKICGLRTAADARAAADAGASMVGLVFITGSPRCINREEAEEILRALPSDVEPVALLADPDDGDSVLAWWRGRVQLHGNESEETCQRIAARGFAVRRLNTYGTAPAVWQAKDEEAAAGAAIAVGPVHAHRPDGGAPHVNAPSVGTQPKKLMKPPQSMPQPPQCCDVLVMSVGCNPVMKGLGQHRIAALEPTCVIAGRLAP